MNTLPVGGSEKFQDKQMFFYNELKKHHSNQSRSAIRVDVTRFGLLNSVCTCICFQTDSYLYLPRLTSYSTVAGISDLHVHSFKVDPIKMCFT